MHIAFYTLINISIILSVFLVFKKDVSAIIVSERVVHGKKKIVCDYLRQNEQTH